MSRRLVFVASIVATAVSCFTLGVLQRRGGDRAERALNDQRIRELRDELQRDVAATAGTTGRTQSGRATDADRASRAEMIAEIKQEIQHDMGLLPVNLIRDRRPSFVELYADDNFGKTSYGTAGYLGHGYFVTVKHAVVALKDEDNRRGTRRVTSVRVVYNGKDVSARVVDYGDAQVEVDKGDWAILKTRDLDLPPLAVDPDFAFDFAEPIFRLGNDYSKGIVAATGYVGQKTGNGLVTALTDGHPGVSGGGVLDQRGNLVGIPIGRMQGDYRFSFILPIRREMLRKVPGPDKTDAVVLATKIQ